MTTPRILVVTTDASLAPAVSDVGYSVVGSAATASEAIAQAAEHAPDLALVDFAIEDMDEAVRSLGCPALCVVGDASEPVPAILASTVGYVRPPWDALALRWALTSALQRCASDARGRERERALEAELKAVIYGIDHDLRGPVRGVDGLVQALIEDYGARLEPDVAAYIERMGATARRMSSLIDGLLRMVRVSTSGQRRVRVDLSRMARVALLERAASSGRQVESVIEDGLVVEGDESLLRTAIECVIDNAWKFTASTRAPRIEVGSFERDGRRVVFVRDNGVGFNPAYTAKLFTPFQRLHSSDEFEGAGLGLATVKRVVDRHGGRVWAEGAIGQGVTIAFAL